MYRLTLYALLFLWITSIVLGFFSLFPFSGFEIFLSGITLCVVSWLVNELLAFLVKTPTNHESAFITGMILTLIVTPATTVSEFWMLGVIASVAMASKYILAIHKKHLFNPAAIGVVLTSLAFGESASWWVGAASMVPAVLVSGYVIIRKIARGDLIYSFIITTVSIGVFYALYQGTDVRMAINQIIISSGLFFFASVMLTEPLTTPPTKKHRIVYGVLTGTLFLPFVHIGSFYTTPELALVFGNLYTYCVSSKERLVLSLRAVNRLSSDLVEFVFSHNKAFTFRAGQYMEWTLDNVGYNIKGNRRYFTIASSPTESDIRLALRVQEPVSAFKKELLARGIGEHVYASHLSGDFTLPPHKNQKMVFIAGGIGITPFRSMIAEMVDTHDNRDVILIYAGRSVRDIVYTDVFEKAHREINVKTTYVVESDERVPEHWNGYRGRITDTVIHNTVADYSERIFYISGSHAFVSQMRKILSAMGVPRSRIKTDYFPGIV